jgi:hypothetical protein
MMMMMMMFMPAPGLGRLVDSLSTPSLCLADSLGYIIGAVTPRVSGQQDPKTGNVGQRMSDEDFAALGRVPNHVPKVSKSTQVGTLPKAKKGNPAK